VDIFSLLPLGAVFIAGKNYSSNDNCLGPNPHMGHLAWADAFVITADSVSMLSEACSTG